MNLNKEEKITKNGKLGFFLKSKTRDGKSYQSTSNNKTFHHLKPWHAGYCKLDEKSNGNSPVCVWLGYIMGGYHATSYPNQT